MLAEGAGVASSPEEWLRDLGVCVALRDPGSDERAFEASADEEAVLGVLAAGPRPADLVHQEAGLTRERFHAAVLGLLAAERVVSLAGDQLGRIT